MLLLLQSFVEANEKRGNTSRAIRYVYEEDGERKVIDVARAIPNRMCRVYMVGCEGEDENEDNDGDDGDDKHTR